MVDMRETRICNFRFSRRTLERLDGLVTDQANAIERGYYACRVNRSDVLRMLIDNAFADLQARADEAKQKELNHKPKQKAKGKKKT
jgi:hypothetical protein